MDGFQVNWLIVSVGWVVFIAILGAGVLKLTKRLEVHPDGKRIFRLDDFIARHQKDLKDRELLRNQLDQAHTPEEYNACLQRIADHLSGSVDPLMQAAGQSLSFTLAISNKNDQ